MFRVLSYTGDYSISNPCSGAESGKFSGRHSVMISDRTFESTVTADYELLNTLDIFSHPMTNELSTSLDDKYALSLIGQVIKPGSKYNKKLTVQGWQAK
jgi:hypothetical protein